MPVVLARASQKTRTTSKACHAVAFLYHAPDLTYTAPTPQTYDYATRFDASATPPVTWQISPPASQILPLGAWTFDSATGVLSYDGTTPQAQVETLNVTVSAINCNGTVATTNAFAIDVFPN
jgi:hypothetical protein